MYKYLISITKKTTPNIIKKIYHILKFKYEALLLVIFFKVKSYNSKGYFSQHGQDYFLNMVLFPLLNSKDILLDGLIDVGCNEPFNNSDTAFFDDKLNIICIDPIDYTSLYNELRKKVKFINVGIDDHQGKLLFYKVRQIDGWEDQMSSFNIPESRFKYDVVEVSIDRLENIINANREFLGSNYGLLIDVEGRHMNVLKSINFEVNRPVFIMLECHAFDLEVYRYLKLNNYKYRYRVGYGDSVFINNFIDS